MEQVTLFAAFAAGLLSFLSPCVFPLVPVYVSHLTESAIQDNRVVADRRLLFRRSISFILGFSAVFVLMGTSVGLIGRIWAEQRQWIEQISGLLIVAFGLQMAGLLHIRLPAFLRLGAGFSKRFNKGVSRGKFRSFMIGVAFGTGWTPCVGMALSSILLLAGTADTVWHGAFLLAVYSLGMGMPFLLLSLIVTRSLGVLRRIHRFLPMLSVANGVLFIAMGLLLFTGQFQRISAWLSGFIVWNA
ncbi:sulfite exporter TauE/SafE family protein [Paenibacillus sp. PR3]|uniref:Sulfite exporter TauE/SafE family protein n=1 Tax=Paenibacillus terricola TaxID=2763503 RepID=A0ABR8MZL8_9BACL|nr:cytochrome c biogenesis protein CcdA [Paenibacillus terricola]MBD3921377.1 sulfite exporter TauE/SafE family protein [Paenibacillus terricola]